MIESFAKRVAEQIDAEAHSGSAFWDELNGPDATMAQVSDDKYVITIPQQYDEDGNETDHVCLITVECGVPS